MAKIGPESEDIDPLVEAYRHASVFVSGKAQALLGSGIADWLEKRD